MAGEVENLSGKLGIDTTDFKTAIAAANREMRVLESSFKAGAAALGDWSQSATGLESRAKTLTSQIDIQKLKVEALRAEHARLAEENGANSRAAQDAEIKLNKETETLNKMSLELNTTQTALQGMQEGTDQTADSVETLGQSTEETSGSMDGFKTALSGIGSVIKTSLGAVLALATAVAAIGAAVGGMVFATASASADLVDLSTKTGISVERLQELDYIAGQVGTSLDTITGAQARLVRTMAAGSDAFNTLGISIRDADGNLRDTQTVFAETIDALSRIENPAERDAVAMEIFGKSAQELNPLIKAGSDELATLAENAHEVGAVMSEENVAAFEAFDDTLASLQAGLKGTVGTLLSAFLPAFQAVFNQVGGYLKTFSEIVNGSGGDFGKVAEGLTGLVTEIATDIATQAPQFLQAGLGIVKSILDAITAALPSMLTAAVAILKSLVDFITQNLPTILNAAVDILLALVNGLVQNLPMLIDAALQAVITLANGLTEALPTLIPAIVQAVITIVQALIDNLPMLLEAAMALILALAEGLVTAMPQLIAAIPVLVEGILAALLEAAPQIAEMGGKLVATLGAGIMANMAVLLAAIAQLIVIAGQNFAAWVASAYGIGEDFIDGIIDGIETTGSDLYTAVSTIVTGMLSEIKKALGIASPSKVGIGLGRNFVGSLALGGEQMLGEMQRVFGSVGGRMAQSLAGGAAVAGNTTNNDSQSFNIFGPVYITGDTTPKSLGSKLKRRGF